MTNDAWWYYFDAMILHFLHKVWHKLLFERLSKERIIALSWINLHLFGYFSTLRWLFANMIFNPHKLGIHKILQHIPLNAIFDAPYKRQVARAVNIADLRLIAKNRAHKVCCTSRHVYECILGSISISAAKEADLLSEDVRPKVSMLIHAFFLALVKCTMWIVWA